MFMLLSLTFIVMESSLGVEWLDSCEKFAISLEKVTKTVAKIKKAKISSSKLNLKAQNIDIQPLLNS